MTTATKVSTLAWYYYPYVYQQLLGEVAEHEMAVLHEDGAYRHIRFAKPGTMMWHFDLITWPGRLVICGDIGEGFIFTRDDDMFAFFASGQGPGTINPGYWAEKLSRGSRPVRQFSQERFTEWLLENRGPDSDAIGKSRDVTTTDEAVGLCDEYDILWDFDSPERWRDFDHHYLLACHAILWGIQKYQAETGARV